MFLFGFQGKPFNFTVIQLYARITNAKEKTIWAQYSWWIYIVLTLNKILPYQIQHTLKGSYIMTKYDLSLGCKYVSAYGNQSMWRIHHINRMKTKNHMIILIDIEKAFDKIWHCFILKRLNKLRTERLYLNIIKAMHEKSIANFTHNREKLKAFLLRLGTKQGCPLSLFLFNIVLEVIARWLVKKTNKRQPYQKRICKIISVHKCCCCSVTKSCLTFFHRWNNVTHRKS